MLLAKQRARVYQTAHFFAECLELVGIVIVDYETLYGEPLAQHGPQRGAERKLGRIVF